MKFAFSYQHARYTAVVMLFVGLMTLGAGIANACLVSATHGHPGSALQVQANYFAAADEHLPDPDKTICLTVCAAEQTAADQFSLHRSRQHRHDGKTHGDDDHHDANDDGSST